jgi:hypothetical protein
MLFHVTQKPRAGYTHDDQKKALEMWARWEPPKGFEVKSFFLAPDGRGFLVVDAETAEALYEAPAPWTVVYLDYDITPVVEVETGVELQQKGMAFREG